MKKLRNKWFLPLFCAALLATGACSEDDTESGTREPLPPTLTTENIPDGGFSFLYSAQEPQTFLLSTDAPWEITKTSGWFVVSPKEGEAGQGIEITVLADQNEGEERTGEFTIRANSGNNLHPVYTEYTVELRQDAFRAAGITVEGLTEDVLTFAAEESAATTLYVTASYDWDITLSDDSWVGISPMNGTASERTAVKVTPKPSTDGKRHEATMTITATDPIYPENTATREIALVQMPPSDSHPEGTVFWQDDFGWVTENWVEPYTKYGWPSVAIDGKNNNEFALSTDGMASAAAEKGYTYSPSVYARYEGHLKLGKTANMGSITTPSLSDIDAGKNATLLVQFDAAAYSSAGGSVDNGDTHFYVSVTPPATIDGMEESEVVFTLGSSRMPVSIYEQSEYKDERSTSLLDRLPSRDDQDEMIEKMLLKSAIEKLPERERKIIYLRYFRDMTQSEVAKAIGVSQVQISRIESRIMQEFRRELSG